MGFLPCKIRVAFPGESQLRPSRAIKPTVHSGCFSFYIIHRPLTWTTGSLTCAQMLMHAFAHGGARTRVRESALKVDSGRKIPCRTEESNLRQRRDGLMLWPTELHSHPRSLRNFKTHRPAPCHNREKGREGVGGWGESVSLNRVSNQKPLGPSLMSLPLCLSLHLQVLVLVTNNLVMLVEAMVAGNTAW